MFPIIWRFLLKQYLYVTLLCCCAIVLILLTTRLDEIAHFASLDPTLSVIGLFILYQIPFVLSVAIPVACLISSILLVQRLSKTHELTALRACGMGLKDFIAPIITAGLFLSIVNFYLISESATQSHLNTNFWKSELRALNPLLVLKNKHLMRLRGGYFDVMGEAETGEYASHVVLALPDGKTGTIRLLLANHISVKNEQLDCRDVTLITTQPNGHEEGFDDLMIENIGQTTMAADDLTHFMQRKIWSVNNDHLTMPQLLSRIYELHQGLQGGEGDKEQKKNIVRCYSEIFRRLSSGLAAFTFTLMGVSFGISISRRQTHKGVLSVVMIAALYLTLFFAAKNFEANFYASLAFYFLPHLIIILLSVRMLQRIARGVEGR